MSGLFQKFLDVVRTQGLLIAVGKVLRYPFRFALRKRYQEMLALESSKDRFTAIYEGQLWNDDESVSGQGSRLEVTANLRRLLPEIVSTYQIASIVDAPCGDFHWMKLVLPELDVSYIGCDIVDALIQENQSRYGGERIRFQCSDITQDPIPHGDLMIVRDCLFHLSYEDIQKFLENFHKSSCKYLLTTTHVNKAGEFGNRNIETGDFRLIDLFSAPFGFDANAVLMEIDDWVPPQPHRQMVLLEKSDVPSSLAL